MSPGSRRRINTRLAIVTCSGDRAARGPGGWTMSSPRRRASPGSRSRGRGAAGDRRARRTRRAVPGAARRCASPGASRRLRDVDVLPLASVLIWLPLAALAVALLVDAPALARPGGDRADRARPRSGRHGPEPGDPARRTRRPPRDQVRWPRSGTSASPPSARRRRDHAADRRRRHALRAARRARLRLPDRRAATTSSGARGAAGPRSFTRRARMATPTPTRCGRWACSACPR